MSKITLKGSPIETVGELPVVGSEAPDFQLTAADLSDKTLSDFTGKHKVLNIVPSLDTPVCALSAQKFNAEISALANTVLLNISADLPFAQKRFCESNSLANVVTLSTMRSPEFGDDYGVRILDGPLAGLMSRAVLVLNAENRVVYGEQVPEIAQEPDYAAAMETVETLEK